MSQLLRIQRAVKTKAENLLWVPALVTRITVGFMFAQTGWGKLHHLDGIVEYFGTLGIPYPHLMAPFVSAVEFVGGSLLILGLFTRISAIPLIVTMIVALLTAKSEDITSAGDLFGLSEYLIALTLFWLLFAGAGCASVDRLIEKYLNKK